MPTSGDYSFFDLTNITPNALEIAAGTDRVAEADKSYNDGSSPPPIVDISPVVEECEKIKRDLEQTIYAYFNECIQVCQTVGGECNACVSGKTQVLLDRIASVAGVCGDKIVTNLWNKVINVGNAMKEIGIPTPTPEQLAAAANGTEIPPPPPPPVPLTPEQVLEEADRQAGDIVADALKQIRRKEAIDTSGNPPPPPPEYSPIPGVILPTPMPTNGNGGSTQQPITCLPDSLYPGRQVIDPRLCYEPEIEPPPPPPPNGEAGWYYVCTYFATGAPAHPTQTPTIEVGLYPNRPAKPEYAVESAVGPFATELAAKNAAIAAGYQPGVVGAGCATVPVPCPPQMQCKPGYHWTTDKNGNPACVPDTPPSPVQPINGIEFCDPEEWERIGGIIERTVGEFNLAGWVQNLGPSGFIGDMVSGIFTGAAEILTNISISATSSSGTGACSSPAFRALSGVNALVGFLGHFGLAPDAMRASYRYSLNYMCQWHIPTTPELNAANVRGYFTKDEWEYGVKLNGDCLPWQRQIRELGFSRIGIRDAYRLNKLGKLSERELEETWRRNAVDWERDAQKWDDAQIQYPPMSDLIRMMQRDIADPAVVSKLDLDSEFGSKWRDFLKTWGESQGISDDVAKAYWRAHWQNAAPGHVYEWLHRFRDDDRDPQSDNRDITFTVKDAKDALAIADYVPGFIKYYIGASYKIPGRVDIRRMYRVGVIKDETALRRKYRDIGYGPKDAADYARFTVISESSARAKLAGAMQESEILRYYTEGIIGKDKAVRLLLDAGVSDNSIGQKLETADTRRNNAYIKKVQSALQKRFFMGEFTKGEVQGELEAIGIDREFVDQIANQWEHERKGRSKHVALGKLCQMFDKSQITMDEYMRRVRNLNYPEADALLLIENCVIGVQERKAKALEQEFLRQKKERERQAKEAARLRRDMQPCRVVKPVCKNGTLRGEGK